MHRLYKGTRIPMEDDDEIAKLRSRVEKLEPEGGGTDAEPPLGVLRSLLREVEAQQAVVRKYKLHDRGARTARSSAS